MDLEGKTKVETGMGGTGGGDEGMKEGVRIKPSLWVSMTME